MPGEFLSTMRTKERYTERTKITQHSDNTSDYRWFSDLKKNREMLPSLIVNLTH